mmetsp:Transcript_1455/g.2681  ORF Transcript_1455/g.2681 Transcript_1455/m.2681 type:complete len:98 (+) Transcript_1455:34-327(+)
MTLLRDMQHDTTSLHEVKHEWLSCDRKNLHTVQEVVELTASGAQAMSIQNLPFPLPFPLSPLPPEPYFGPFSAARRTQLAIHWAVLPKSGLAAPMQR